MSAIRLLCIWCQIEFEVGHWTTALDQGAKHTSDNTCGGPCLCRLGCLEVYIEVLKGGLKKNKPQKLLGRGNTSLIHRTDVDDDTCFFLAFERFILEISMMITKSCPRCFWSRELLGGDVTVNGGFETLLLLKLLILGALHDARVVLFCKLMACYENKTCRKGKRGKKSSGYLKLTYCHLQCHFADRAA